MVVSKFGWTAFSLSLVSVGLAAANLEPSADNEQVIWAAVLHRHGDRSPAECFPKFMDECQQNWPYGLGKLTALGMNQTNTLGQFIRKRYMEKLKLIGQQPGREGQYSPLDIRVRSTSYDRTLMSVTSVLQGIYPPGSGIVQPDGYPGITAENLTAVPIFTLPTAQDSMLRSWTNATCVTYYASRQEEQKRNAEAYKEKEKQAADLLKQLKKITGMTLTIDNLYQIYDVLNARLWHDFKWPKEIDDAMFEQIVKFNDWGEFQMFNSTTLKKKSSGVFLDELRVRISHAVQGTAQPDFAPANFPWANETGPSFYIYSAHDTTIKAVLNGMRALSDPTPNPPYASSLAWEVVRLPSASHNHRSGRLRKQHANQLFVRIFYNKGLGDADPTSHISGPEPFNHTNIITDKIPGCESSGELCPLDKFMDSIKVISTTQGEWDAMCSPSVPSHGGGNENKNVSTSVLAGSIVGSVVASTLITALIGVSCYRKKQRDLFQYQTTED